MNYEEVYLVTSHLIKKSEVTMYCGAYNVLIKVINEYLLVHLTHHAEFSASSWSNFGVMVGHP